MKNKKSGFTLVELLAVIVILAIILVIAVPKVMTIIEDSKKATLETTAKMIASAAEKAFVQNTILDKQKDIECNDVVKINTADYERCIIEFDNNGKAKVTIKGSGKFDNINICAGDKTSSTASDNNCTVEYTKASTYIEKLEAFTDDNGLITDTSPDKNIRYAGATPNNKVYFNCKDKDTNNVVYGEANYDYASSCEVWRIIGVFDVAKTSGGKTEKRVKIVRDAFSVEMSWDSSASNGETDNNSGNGINQWGPSTYADGTTYEGADLMRMLNGYYIGVENATCTYCNGANQGICENDCSRIITPLSTTSLSMVEDSLWSLGSESTNDPMTVLAVYKGERGMQTGKICESTTIINGVYYCTDIVNRTTEWVGKIGLIYASDYGYASAELDCSNDVVNENSTCNMNNWLHPITNWYWTISPGASTSYNSSTWRVSIPHRLNTERVMLTHAVRPSLYLSHNVQITGGDGNTIPFKLSA